VVSKTIRDFMGLRVADGGLGMRNYDIARSYNVAVCMYFLPNHQSVVLNEITKYGSSGLEESLAHFGLDGSE